MAQSRHHSRTLFHRDDSPIVVSRHKLNGACSQHDHDFLELAYITGGRGVHRCASGDLPLRRGHVIVVLPGVWHAYLDTQDLRVINCLVRADLLEHELAWAREDPYLGHLFWRHASVHHLGLHLFVLPVPAMRRSEHELEMLHDLPHEHADLRPRRGEILARLLLLWSELASHLGPDELARIDARRDLPPTISRVLDHIARELDHPWSLDEMAAIARVNRAYLVRQFTRHLGRPPIAHLDGLRMQRASEILLATDLPIGDVARRVGHPDANYFARRFRAAFGCSASAYRQRMRS